MSDSEKHSEIEGCATAVAKALASVLIDSLNIWLLFVGLHHWMAVVPEMAWWSSALPVAVGLTVVRPLIKELKL